MKRLFLVLATLMTANAHAATWKILIKEESGKTESIQASRGKVVRVNGVKWDCLFLPHEEGAVVRAASLGCGPIGVSGGEGITAGISVTCDKEKMQMNQMALTSGPKMKNMTFVFLVCNP